MAAPPPLVVTAAARMAATAIDERDGGGNDGNDGITVPKNPLKVAAAVTERTRWNRRGIVPAPGLWNRNGSRRREGIRTWGKRSGGGEELYVKFASRDKGLRDVNIALGGGVLDVMEHSDVMMVSLDGMRSAVLMAVSPPEGLGVEERGGGFWRVWWRIRRVVFLRECKPLVPFAQRHYLVSSFEYISMVVL